MSGGRHALRRDVASHELRQRRAQLVEDAPELTAATAWWACSCGRWHHVSDDVCPVLLVAFPDE